MTETDAQSHDLTRRKEEKEAVDEAVGLSPRLVFETIRRNGEEELERPMRALWFSGIAAGLLISFSVLGEAILRAHLPDAPWRYIVENAGYSLGFLLVILGRMQLFTENTITTVIPVTLKPTRHAFERTIKLWCAVLAANVVGAFLIAGFFAYAGVLSDEVFSAMVDLSHHATGMPSIEGMMRGIPAGILIAALVWMLPSSQGSEIGIIILFTWLIALGDFTHIVAGSVEMAFLLVQAEIGVNQAVFGFFIPVLIGNIVGGTVIFTMLTWAQVQPEVAEENESCGDRLQR
ncbi:MAG: formate/nitrite transporter family protein [Roseobacter sp.]